MNTITLALVAIGGAIGACLRYALVLALRPHSPGFPTGTLIVNLIGCLCIGALAGFTSHALSSRADSKLWALLAIGVLGGFTTFSSFSLETVELARDGKLGLAALYVLASNTLGIALAAGGYWITHTLTRA